MKINNVKNALYGLKKAKQLLISTEKTQKNYIYELDANGKTLKERIISPTNRTYRTDIIPIFTGKIRETFLVRYTRNTDKTKTVEVLKREGSGSYKSIRAFQLPSKNPFSIFNNTSPIALATNNLSLLA